MRFAVLSLSFRCPFTGLTACLRGYAAQADRPESGLNQEHGLAQQGQQGQGRRGSQCGRSLRPRQERRGCRT